MFSVPPRFIFIQVRRPQTEFQRGYIIITQLDYLVIDNSKEIETEI